MKQSDLTLAEAAASDLVLCRFCKAVYTNPLLLPCLHTFCHKCIVAMATAGTLPVADSSRSPTSGRRKLPEGPAPVPHNADRLQLICPTCRAPIILQVGDSDDDNNDDVDDNDETDFGISHGEEISDGDRSQHRQGPSSRIGQVDTDTSNHVISEPLEQATETAGRHVDDTNVPTKRSSLDASRNHVTESETANQRGPEKDGFSNGRHCPKKQLRAVECTVSKSLPVNYFLQALAGLHRHHNNQVDKLCVYCKTEDVQVAASSLCLQCQDDVCQACAKAHRKTRLTREHQVVPFESIQRGLFDHDIRVAMGSIPCFQHPELSVRYFCPECQVVICKQCRAGNHARHALLSLTDAVATFLPEIRRIQEALVRSSLSMAEYADFLSTQIKTLESAKESAITEIHRQTEVIIQMINTQKKQICSSLETEFQKEKKVMEAKVANARTCEHSNGTSSVFLRHLMNLGNAQEQMAMYFHIAQRHKELVAARPDVMKSKLCLNFNPGPNTKANVSILMGKLEAKRIAMSDQDAPLNHQLLSSLMPPVESPPDLLATIEPSSKTAYPSGLACQGNMLAVVDRENQRIQVFNLQNMKLLTQFGASQGRGTKQGVKFQKPFDLAFLPNGILAITDPEASQITLCEWTGKFIAHFKDRVRHPRGITVNEAGEVVVVDGYLRQLTVHHATSGEIIRTIQPFRQTDVSSGLSDHQPQVNDQGIENEQENSPQSPFITSSLRPPILIDPYYINISNEGNLIVSDIASPNLKILDPNGQLLTETMDYGTGPDQNLHPSGVCVDKHGYILVADTNNDRIHLGLPDGHMTEESFLSPSDGLSHPVSLCLTQEGHLVIGQSGGQIKLYNYIK